MATSLVATGVQFPDATIQTTAAGAGGSSLEAIASGSLSDGSTVIVNADGTVSVVAGVAQAVGTPVVFESASSEYISTTYDPDQQKVIVAYRDNGNSGYGTAIVGTVSGTSISFGTPVIFKSADSSYIKATYDTTNDKLVIVYFRSSSGEAVVGTVSGTSISFGAFGSFGSAASIIQSTTYDSTNNKVVVAYKDALNSSFGTSIVGTVSGTSISFGTPVVFESATTEYITSTYDSNAQKIVIAYTDDTNSSYGTAIVGTVSGTSISFGTAVVFRSAATAQSSATFDSTNNKVIIAYRDGGNSLFGTSIVGTVSGTSISFGTAVVFESARADYVSATYDSNAQKVIIAYRDVGNSNYGTVISGTVSGTSVSFGTAAVFESAATLDISSTYDANAQKVVIAYRDAGNANYGTSVVFQPESTNLTSENYIGISDGAYTDAATATIQLVGSVDDAQSGLTAGQKYYVQTDGTLSETPATPSVLAGTAQSATKLIIKR